VTLDAIKQLGPNARGVAVVRPTITDAELKVLDAGGVRGIRFSLADPTIATTTVDMIESLSKRINLLGWHVQINMGADQIAAVEALVEQASVRNRSSITWAISHSLRGSRTRHSASSNVWSTRDVPG